MTENATTCLLVFHKEVHLDLWFLYKVSKQQTVFFVKFADDFLLVLENKKEPRKTTDELVKQIVEKDLILSVTKSKLMCFGRLRKKDHTEFEIDENIVEAIKEANLLGCTISNDLKWESHLLKSKKKKEF